MGLMPVPASAVNPFFITADMLQPPWADPFRGSDFDGVIGMPSTKGFCTRTPVPYQVCVPYPPSSTTGAVHQKKA